MSNVSRGGLNRFVVTVDTVGNGPINGKDAARWNLVPFYRTRRILLRRILFVFHLSIGLLLLWMLLRIGLKSGVVTGNATGWKTGMKTVLEQSRGVLQ